MAEMLWDADVMRYYPRRLTRDLSAEWIERQRLFKSLDAVGRETELIPEQRIARGRFYASAQPFGRGSPVARLRERSSEVHKNNRGTRPAIQGLIERFHCIRRVARGQPRLA